MGVIQALEIDLFCQATEDWERVRRAVREVVGVTPAEKKLQGYWSNPILHLTARVEGKLAEELASRIAESVEISDFKSRSGKNAFYVRLDKKAFVKGKFRAGNDVRVVFRLKLFPSGEDRVAGEMRKFWAMHKSSK